jgi:uncharacterized protein (DUF3820 family)
MQQPNVPTDRTRGALVTPTAQTMENTSTKTITEMPWGKWRGLPLTKLPDLYLKSLWVDGRLEGELREAIRLEMKRRAYEHAQRPVKRFRVPILPDGRYGHLQYLGVAA